LLATAITAQFAPTASAQSTRIDVHDPYFAGMELGTRGLKLANQGLNIELDRGGRVDASIEFLVDCQNGCAPREQQQVLVGFANAPEAQACVWQGAGSTNGWLAARFALELPNVPGVYELRARKTRARSCAEAMTLWKNHRGDDPTIGVIVVDTSTQPSRGDRRKNREIAELQRAFDATLIRQEQVQRQLLDLSSRPANAKRLKDINTLVRESITLTKDLRLIQTELREELEDRNNPGRQRPRIIRPTIAVVADLDPFPVGMPHAEFQAFLARIDKATFSHHQVNAIKDTLTPGVLLGVIQAKAILAKFMHESHKTEVAVLLCPKIIERNVLPEILSTFTFESYRDEVRSQTGGRCGGAQ
jgi:hypothetical protein